MLNYMKADLYRLVHAASFWVFMLTYPALIGLCAVVAEVLGAGWIAVFPESISLVPNMEDAGIAPIMVALFFTSFILLDAKQGALKSMLAGPHSRSDYVLAKAATLLVVCACYVATMQLLMTLTCLLSGVPFEPFGPAEVLAGFAAMTLATAAGAALGFALAMLGKAPNFMTFVAFLAAAGTFEGGLALSLSLTSVLVPWFEPIAHAVVSVLWGSATAPLEHASTIALNADLGFCMLVCAGYVVVAVLASLAIMRRRDIS